MLSGLIFFVKFGWRHEKRYIVYRVFNQFISSMIPIVAMIMPRFIIDELLGLQRVPQIVFYASVLIGYTFAASAISSRLGWTAFSYRLKISQAFNTFMHEKTINADYADIESSQYLEMKEKAEKFLFGNMRGFSYLLDMAIEIIGKLFTLVGVIAVVASLSPLMVLLFAAIAAVAGYAESRIQRKQADLQLKVTVSNRRVVFFGQLLEDFSYGKEIRINCMGEWLMAREKQHWNEGYELYRQYNSLAVRSGVFASLANLVQQAAAYAYLVARVIGGHITIGDFSMYAAGVAGFTGALRGLLQNIVEVAEYRKYYEAIEEYLNIPAKMRDNKRLPVPCGPHEIEFRNVSFAYPGQTGFAIENLCLTLRPGQKLAIVGENGAGKSTFVKLLCRIYDPSEGAIYLNGVNIRDIDYDGYAALYSTVFQDYKLYALSLKDNVALSRSDFADDGEVEAALCKAGFAEKLRSLPKGVHTLVYRNFDGDGFKPSGGEGQKIALARALFKNGPVVILDEPTAALDPRAEHDLYLRFSELTAGKTAVYISHRLSSAQFCDQIAVFKQGRLVQYGPHTDLLNDGGPYAELFTLQSQYYTRE